MKKLLTPQTIGLALLGLALAVGLWYALREEPKADKLTTSYTFI